MSISIPEEKKLYVPRGADAQAIALALTDSRQVCYVAQTAAQFNNLSEIILFFSPDVEVLTLPAWDVQPYDIISPSPAITIKRMQALYALTEPARNKRVFLTTYHNIIQRTIHKEILKEAILTIQIGDRIHRERLLCHLNAIGYIRSATADNAGEYAVRGGIVDIAHSSDNHGIRISFFGDDVENIKIFDTQSQLTLQWIDSCKVYPASEALLSEANVKRFQDRYLRKFGAINDPLFEAVKSGIRYSGVEHWLPLFYEGMGTIFDYIPSTTPIMYREGLQIAVEQYQEQILSSYELRKKLSHEKKQKALTALEPNSLYILESELSQAKRYHNTQILTSFNDTNQHFSQIEDFSSRAKLENKPVTTLLGEHMKELLNSGNKVLLCCISSGSMERLQALLHNFEIHIVQITSFQELEHSAFPAIAVLPIEHGYVFENYTLIAEAEVLGTRAKARTHTKKATAKFLREASRLLEGELVVHVDHGIGRFQCLETLDIEGIVHDFIKIVYRDDDKLYVPVENLDLISRYGGGDAVVELDKLGAAQWQSRKAKLKNRLKLAAAELLKTAARRSLANGALLEPRPELYEAFCRKFPYAETEDQLNAIQDIENDLRSGKPMDRLICGDVGFGKTETAMRAACIAVSAVEPVQVAVIVPSTLLARQHYQNFCNRFEGLSVNIEVLSRFTNASIARKIKDGLSSGTIDIVIGTHALLNKEIKFKNLGLVIIDEEQHFGVAQKERLKELKADLHVLTLSATPIPRTLQMSLTGIKDLSLITTPPVDREPIKTYVMPYDSFTIREAILKEKNRGGSVFYVTPRIAYIDTLLADLKEAVPEIKVEKAHGRMSPSELDKLMNDFYDRKFDVLLSTTIVESGLDIPFANTMIIDKAEMLGLSQLYQLRGRIGRSNVKAYAYMIVQDINRLNSASRQRLEVIQSLTTLGSGFSVASYDMDIRGHGNLVGEEQAGNVKEVGIELYQEMLREAVESIRGSSSDDNSWSPSINIGVSVKIPEEYVSDNSLRLAIYRKIAQLSSHDELEEFAAEMVDRFGSLPEEANQLFEIVRLKQYAKQLNIEKIDLGQKALVISFRKDGPPEHARVMEFLSHNRHDTKLRQDGSILVMREWKEQHGKIKGVEKILLQLIRD